MSSRWRAGARECGTKVAMTRVQGRPKQERKLTNMKTKIISKLLLTLGLVLVLGSAITQVSGQRVVTIHSAGDVTREQTGSFVLTMSAPAWNANVNFSISGTAIPGVDYVPLVSPVLVRPVLPCPPPCEFCTPCGPGLGVIRVKTLPDLRASFVRQPYSVVATLEPGVGYTIGEPSSAQLLINP